MLKEYSHKNVYMKGPRKFEKCCLCYEFPVIYDLWQIELEQTVKFATEVIKFSFILTCLLLEYE